jgi:hypothetical protein
MALQRGFDGSDPVGAEPVGRVAGRHEERRRAGAGRLATGTLACPACDAPVAPGDRPLAPAELFGCPFCDHAGAVRDFLSLASPTRPARVIVRVVAPATVAR